MTGGIRRRGGAIERLRAANRIVLLDDGGIGGPPGAVDSRQSQLKAEMMAQALNALDAAAIHLTARDARLGPGSLDQVIRLSGGRFVSSNLEGPAREGVKAFTRQGPFVIGGYSAGVGASLGAPERSLDATVNSLLGEAGSGTLPVLMLDGARDAATAVARRYPGLAAVVYRHPGWPPDKVERVGRVWLLTPGERGKSIIRATVFRGELAGYAVTRLNPDVPDDPAVSRYYRTYLTRVDSENLLKDVPRLPSPAFAGSKACASCHPAAYQIWQSTGHSRALATLEREWHGRDPECVSCHVVGLDLEAGFRSRTETPDLAFVGCEACHGPAAAHSADPHKSPMQKIGGKICVTCHTPDQSPGFSFLTFWPKVSHR